MNISFNTRDLSAKESNALVNLLNELNEKEKPNVSASTSKTVTGQHTGKTLNAENIERKSTEEVKPKAGPKRKAPGNTAEKQAVQQEAPKQQSKPVEQPKQPKGGSEAPAVSEAADKSETTVQVVDAGSDLEEIKDELRSYGENLDATQGREFRTFLKSIGAKSITSMTAEQAPKAKEFLVNLLS